jgi:hypothetical protein
LFKANPGKYFMRPHLNQWLDIVACVCHFSYMRKQKLEDYGPDQSNHKMRPCLKNIQSKRAGGLS